MGAGASLQEDVPTGWHALAAMAEAADKPDLVAKIVREHQIDAATALEVGHSVEAMSRQTRELQESVMAIRAQPVKSVFSRMPRVVRDLADKLGVSRPSVVSTRDVPGMPRSAIPILKEAGVTAMSEGMNGRMVMVNAPPAFNWRDPNSGEEMLTLWHWHGYGGVGDPGWLVHLPRVPVGEPRAQLVGRDPVVGGEADDVCA